MKRPMFARMRHDQIRRPFGGIGFAGPVVPEALLNQAKRNGWLAAVVPPKKLAGLRLAGLGATTAQKNLVGQGVSIGASFGPIGAVIGGVVGAVGAAFMKTGPAEAKIFDEWKNYVNVRGVDLDDQFRNEAFVGFFRLGGKSNWPPKVKYGQRGDAQYLDAMAAQIAQAIQAGQIGGTDDAQSIFDKIVQPWGASFGGAADWNKGPADWVNFGKRAVIQQIDAYLFDHPIVATSYTGSRWANPRLSSVIQSLPQVAPAPATPTSPAPVAAVPIAPPPVATAPKPAPTPAVLPPALAAQLPVSTVAQPASTPPPTTVTQTPAGPQVDVNALVSSLMQQGASNQQAFLQAMQSLQSQGVAATPAVQQAVADQVSTAATATQAGASVPDWLKPVGVVAAVVMLGFALARPKRH
jgi:hypothetical protein